MIRQILGALLVLFLFTSPASAKMMKHINPGPGVGPGLSLVNGSGGGSATQADNLLVSANCSGESGNQYDLCNDSDGAGGGIWWCSTGTCSAAGWLRADDGRTFSGTMRGLDAVEVITDASYAWIEWDNFKYDDGWWEAKLLTDPDEYLVVPAGIGGSAITYVEICAGLQWEASATTYFRFTTRVSDLAPQSNFDDYISGSKGVQSLINQSCTGPMPAVVDDTLKVFGLQDSDGSGTLDILTTYGTFFSVRALR